MRAMEELTELDAHGHLLSRPAPFDASLIGIIRGTYNRKYKSDTVRGYGKKLFPQQ